MYVSARNRYMLVHVIGTTQFQSSKYQQKFIEINYITRQAFLVLTVYHTGHILGGVGTLEVPHLLYITVYTIDDIPKRDIL